MEIQWIKKDLLVSYEGMSLKSLCICLISLGHPWIILGWSLGHAVSCLELVEASFRRLVNDIHFSLVKKWTTPAQPKARAEAKSPWRWQDHHHDELATRNDWVTVVRKFEQRVGGHGFCRLCLIHFESWLWETRLDPFGTCTFLGLHSVSWAKVCFATVDQQGSFTCHHLPGNFSFLSRLQSVGWIFMMFHDMHDATPCDYTIHWQILTHTSTTQGYSRIP